MKKQLITASVTVLVGVAVLTPFAYAATTANSTLTQSITAGALSTDVRNGSNGVVAAPSFAMSAATVSTSQQTVSGTFGTAAQRISVDNPGGANNGWTLTLNATTPGTGTWTSGANSYAYNGTAAAGQLTVDPSVANLTSSVGASTGITKGSSAAFSGTNAITLLNAAAASDDIWNGYLTGVGLSQTIPGATPAGSYSLSVTQTVTAN